MGLCEGTVDGGHKGRTVTGLGFAVFIRHDELPLCVRALWMGKEGEWGCFLNILLMRNEI